MKFCVELLSLLLLLLTLTQNANAANILFYHNIASYSHRVATYPLADALAKKGHQVNYITPFKNRGPYINPDIIEVVPRAVEESMQSFLDEGFDINLRVQKVLPRIVHQFYPMAIQACEQLFTSPEFAKWTNVTSKLDLVIMDNCMAECGLAIAHKYGAKHMYFNTVVHLANEYDQYGFQPESGVIPELEIDPAQTPMSFMERVFNTLISIHFRWVHYSYMRDLEVMLRSHINDTSMPSLDEMGRNTSLVLYTGDIVTDYPRAHPPLLVNVGGLLCKDGRNTGLPESLQKVIEDPSKEGFVYISFGSLAVSSKLPPEIKQVFYDSVRAFPQLTFLWKWDAETPKGIPSNIILQKWFPQVALLEHPKIKGFVTQGGRPSTMEALCNLVPMIAFPVLGDQDVNSNRLNKVGASLRLELSTVTTEQLKAAIKKMVYDPTMKERMVELREILNDRPVPPLETAVWWTEYVLRHKNTYHLRAASFDQWWFQRRLIDVWAFLFTLILGMAICLLCIFKKAVSILIRDNFRERNNRALNGNRPKTE